MNDESDIGDRFWQSQSHVATALERVNCAGSGAEADAARIDLLRALEDLKNVATAVQALATVAFARSQRAEQVRQGVRGDQVGRGVAEQIALARRESPHRGAIFLGVASILVAEMPHALNAMAAGVLTEHRAQILVHETSCVSRQVRGEVDQVVAGDLERLGRLGTRRLTHLVRGETYRRDPQSSVARIAYAVRDRFVSIRPAPDCMVRLTALLPVAQGVAAYAALSKAADTARAQGDPRSRGQVMADELVVRLTGQTSAEAVPLALHLILPADTLLNRGQRPGVVLGHGPIPADLARHLVQTAPAVASWVRRLYRAPTGRLVAMESRRRLFPKGLAEFITIRDQICRTPFCDAPIRHLDHILPKADGGATSAENGQGLCERCNYARQANGWTARTMFKDLDEARAPDEQVVVTTPTGHDYTGEAPRGW